MIETTNCAVQGGYSVTQARPPSPWAGLRDSPAWSCEVLQSRKGGHRKVFCSSLECARELARADGLDADKSPVNEYHGGIMIIESPGGSVAASGSLRPVTVFQSLNG